MGARKGAKQISEILQDFSASTLATAIEANVQGQFPTLFVHFSKPRPTTKQIYLSDRQEMNLLDETNKSQRNLLASAGK